MSKTDVSIQTTSDGAAVVLTIANANGEPFSATLPSDSVGLLVTGLLGAALSCDHLRSQAARPLSKAAGRKNLKHYVQAKGATLAETDRPDTIGMIFSFGTADLNIALTRAALQPLGKALLAAVGSERSRH